MCTVLYIPGNDKSTLVSLRDESPLRLAAQNPKLFQQGEITALYPRDPIGGGTWVGANDKGIIIILLNGGFVCHERKEQYAKSRGLIVSELLMTSDPVNQWMQFDLSAIEPHTLVILQHKKLFQLVWDGDTAHQIQKDENACHIWSSSTLYNEVASKRRNEIYSNWVDNFKEIHPPAVLVFFLSFSDNQNGFIINRNEKVKTLSMSYLEITERQILFNYQDFITNNVCDQFLKINLT